MSDLIRRADAIEAVARDIPFITFTEDYRRTAERIIGTVLSAEAVSREEYDQLEALYDAIRVYDSSAEATGDLISRELAMERIANDNVVGGMERINEYNNSTEFNEYLDGISDAITTIFCDVPSADITETETCQRCQKSIDTVLNRQGERIKALEASAEAVQGEWVRKYDDKINCYWYECDQCGEYRPRNQFGHEYNSNFCPNCGARMKGGDSE